MGYNFQMRSGPIKKARYSSHNRQECQGGCRLAELGRLSPRWHHSKEEARYCDQLMLIVRAKRDLKSYRSQARYDLHDKVGRAVGYMMVDFEVIRMDGVLEIHEYKGGHLVNTPEFRHKKALFTWCYPHIQYHVVGRKQIVL